MKRQMFTIDYSLLTDCAICGLAGYGVRWRLDRKKDPKPDGWFQLFASIGSTYIGYFTYNFYKIKFTPIELWIFVLSFMGAFLVTSIDFVSKNGILIYLRKLAEDFLAFTKADKKL